MNNSIFVIHPYKYYDVWVFDDPDVGLIKEAFVSGMPEIIDRLTARLHNPQAGFTLYFSISPFPGYTLELTHSREEMGGNWYVDEKTGMEGWLCPALFKYFDATPEKLYAKAVQGEKL